MTPGRARGLRTRPAPAAGQTPRAWHRQALLASETLDVLLRIGHCQTELQNVDAAMEAYREAKALEPKHRAAGEALAADLIVVLAHRGIPVPINRGQQVRGLGASAGAKQSGSGTTLFPHLYGPLNRTLRLARWWPGKCRRKSCNRLLTGCFRMTRSADMW